MTEKRFTITGDRSISDHHKRRLYDLSDFDGMISVTECLNELHEENQLVKDTLNELKSIDGFWDSALLQGYISKIAKILGVDLE